MSKRHSLSSVNNRRIWPLKDMAVGDYFYFPISGNGSVAQRYVSAYCCDHAKGMKFKTMQLPEQVRVERIA